MPSAPLVFTQLSSSSASSTWRTRSATSTTSAKPTSGDGSRSNSTQSGRSGLSTREYQVFMSMQPMFTIHRSPSSSSTIGASIFRRVRGLSRVVTSNGRVSIQSGMCDGASFWKNIFPSAPSG